MTSPQPTRRSDRGSKLYRLLVRLMPFDFRFDFGEQMIAVFREERHDAARGGRRGLLSLWIRTMDDMLKTALRQHLDAIRQDVVHAWRTLWRTPGLTAVAVLSLALGIGANTAIFELLNALFLRGVPVAELPSELVGVYGRADGRTISGRMTPGDLDAIRDGTKTLSGVAGHTETWAWLADEKHEPVELSAQVVSPGFFAVLGLRPLLGQLLDSSDQHARAIVLAHHVWQSRFAGDPGVLGRGVTLNQRRFTVVGVAPRGFTGIYPGESRDLWILAGTYDGWSTGEDFDLIGRLVPGRTVDEAQAELTVIVRALRAGVSPEIDRAAMSRESPVLVTPLVGVRPWYRQQAARTPLILAGVVAFLLLIACANLAGLLLARGASRRHEMAVRVSLGAGRGRLVRQLLTESLLLSGIGAAAGVAVSVWASTLIERHFSYLFDRLELGFDLRVLAFMVLVSIVSGLAFGLAPALDSSRVAPFGSLQSHGVQRTTGRSRLRIAFLIGQVALSMALLVGALLMIKSVGHLVDRPGYAQHDVAHYRLRPSRIKYDADRADRYYHALTTELMKVPGVRAVVFATFPPVRGWGSTTSVERSRGEAGDAPRVESILNAVSPGYFRELGIPLVKGREIDETDRPRTAAVAVVNEALAARLWPGANPLGRGLRIESRDYAVVGVARDIYAAREGEAPLNYVYLSHAQQRGVDARLFVRVDGDADAMVAVLRRHVVAIDPHVHVGQEMTLHKRTTLSFELERLTARVLAGSGAAALLLTAIGLYGVLSFWVGQRTREIGVRMTLGADRRSIQRLVVGQGMAPVAVGLVAGALLALLSVQMLTTVLYGVSAHDPLSIVGALLLVALVALVACALPARRATRVDPAISLRAE